MPTKERGGWGRFQHTKEVSWAEVQSCDVGTACKRWPLESLFELKKKNYIGTEHCCGERRAGRKHQDSCGKGDQ